MATRVLLATLLVTISLQGCLGGVFEQGCQDAGLTVLAGPMEATGIPRAPGEPTQFLYWINHTGDQPGTPQVVFEQPSATTLQGAQAGLEGHEHPESQELPPGNISMHLFDGALDPTGAPTELAMAAQISDGATDCTFPDAAQDRLLLQPEAERERAQVGQGVQVYTAGFWPNGTLFYTNMEHVQFERDIPHPEAGEMGEWGGGDPLPVYIYEDSSEEQPARYEEAGYFTTIEGFNEALKGMPEGTARVAVLDPEEAYTVEDREDHALYGDPLIFYIELVAIEEVPCEVPEPVCEVPRPPVVG